jgi:predicted dehydrogenase
MTGDLIRHRLIVHAMTSRPPRISLGLVGLTGYGGVIRQLLEDEQQHPDGRTTLAAVFAPDADQHVETIARLQTNGATMFDSYDALLASDIEAVWLPTPIDLHRPMAEAALAAGKAVMLEKPVAGSIQDHDAIARAAEAAKLPVAVGFQDIYRPTTLALKRRLLAGDFGTPRGAVVWGLWPRDDTYYARSTWAGKLRRDGAWVLDSPIANAMAHYVNLGLFLLGPTDYAAAEPEALAGETLRGRPTIENADTFSLRLSLAGGVECVVLLTHATDDFEHPSVTIDTNRGTLRVEFNGEATFTRTGDSPEEVVREAEHRPAMARRFAQFVRNEPNDDVAVATLATSRPHSLLITAIAAGLPITPVPPEHRTQTGAGPHVVQNLGQAIRQAAKERQTLGESGGLGFNVPSGRVSGLASLNELHKLHGE